MSSSIKLPRQLPLLVIDNVLFPGAATRIPIVSYKNTLIGLVLKDECSKDNENEQISLHQIGTAGMVVQVTGTNWPRPAFTLLVTGVCRFSLESLIQESPYLIGVIKQLDKLPEENLALEKSDKELVELIKQFRNHISKLMEMLDISDLTMIGLKRSLNSLPALSLPDIFASIVRASQKEKLEILNTVDYVERFKKVIILLTRQIETLQKTKKKNGLLNTQHLQLEKIFPLAKKQYIDFDDDESEDRDDIKALGKKIKLSTMPDHAKKVATNELNRLKKMPVHMPEHAMIRTYLELMIDLPWSKISPETIDLNKSKKNLDQDHYGLEKLKKRVLEYLAVRQLKSSLKGPILCFVGPPGVGKTSVGKSIAKSLGRKFHRISLGGVCDQSDIRGHRRTYIGSMPGRIIQGLRSVGVRNPVFLMDEIDKLSSGIHGDPAAALLEVLDPEQNCNFLDHYLNVPFDLSQVLFIATANTIKTIPPALLDRMEVIYISGYTLDEKLNITMNHLLPKQLKEHGLHQSMITCTEEALRMLISQYTREAGLRNLERKISDLCRSLAVKIVEKKKFEILHLTKENTQENQIDFNVIEQSFVGLNDLPIVVDTETLENILGPPLFESEHCNLLNLPGVACGLAYTAVGGDIMLVEAIKIEGDGELILTGQLGKVMKESAQIALNWVRTHAHKYQIPLINGNDLMENSNVHIHFPAGAVLKDGPSAGITIVTALISLFTNKIVRSDIAMTGEITLRGLILPVGGIKAKVLAAHRAGIKQVILPKRNEKDLQEISLEIKKNLIFHLVTTIDEVLNIAFEDDLNSHQKNFHIQSNL